MTKIELKRTTALFIFSALIFLFPALQGKTLFVGDMCYSFQPWLTYAAQEIQSGRLPLWNPYTACGEPFMANPQVMAFNPLAIVYWLFPFATANGLFFLINEGLLYLFTYLLARRWSKRPGHLSTFNQSAANLGALGLAWGGFAVSHWEFPSAVGTLWSLPLFFLLGLGESWGALTVGWVITFFSGYTQFSYYAGILAGAGAAHAAFSQNRTAKDRARVFLFLAGTTAVGIVMALPQILISWENVRHSLRVDISTEFAGMHLLSPIFMLKLWIPRITNTVALAFQKTTPFGPEFWPIQRNWLATFFMGTPLCILGLAGFLRGPRAKTAVLVAVSAVGAAWAFGIPPFFEWSRACVPGFRYLTHFANASILLWLSLVLSSTNMAHPQPKRNVFTAFVTFVLLGTALGLAMSPDARRWVLHHMLGIPSLSAIQDRWVMQSGGTAATAVLMFAGVWLFFRHKKGAALWVMTLVELGMFARGLQPWGPRTLFQKQPALVQSLAMTDKRVGLSPATMKGSKIMAGRNLEEGYESVREVLYPNVPLAYRIHQTWGYEVFGIKEFVEYRRRVPDRPGESAMLDFLGAQTLLSTTELPPPSQLMGQRPNALLYHRSNALSRTTVVENAVVIAGAEERLTYLSSRWDPRREVVIESPTAPPPTPSTPPIPTEDIRLTQWSDGPGRARADGSGKGWLVRSESFYPGWSCWVNGRRVPIERANHAFQAVPVPDGQWTAWWRYRPPLFQIGLGISTLTGLLCLGWIVRSTNVLPKRG